MVEEKVKSGGEKEEGQASCGEWPSTDNLRRLTCHPDRFALDMILDTFLGGKRNYMCSEILPYLAAGSENVNCPNARSTETFLQPVLSHKAQKSHG